MSVNVGLQLRQRREERLLTLEQAAAATRIRPHYLRSLEAGDLAAIPSMAQARGFLRAYADFLGIDSDTLLAELDGKPASSPPPVPVITAVEEPPLPVLEELDKTVTSPTDEPASQDSTTHTVIEPVGKGTNTEIPTRPRPIKSNIFQEIGQTLQRQRELLGLSLDDVEHHTHLRRHYLEALEAGDLPNLPSPVQGRGMLNNYASFLGLNPEPLLLRFADGLQMRLAANQATEAPASSPARPKKKKKATRPSWLRRILAGDLLIGGLLAVFLLIFISWLAIRIFSVTTSPEVRTSVTAPSVVDVLLATETPTVTPTPAPATPTQTSLPQPFPSSMVSTDPATGATIPPAAPDGVQIYISVLQRAYLRATVDGVIEFDGRVIPGSAYTFAGSQSVEILTGNAAGLQVFFNGIDLGTLGAFGQVANRLYGMQGPITPTPSVTPTPTQTVPVPPTEIPTGTPVPGIPTGNP